MLIALTKPDKESPGGSLSGLNDKYRMILKRRLHYNQDWVKGVSGNPEELLQKVFTAFESLKDIAEMNEKVLLSAPA
jgi:hypothetical protein